MKRFFLSILIAILSIFCFVGCGDEEKKNPAPPTGTVNDPNIQASFPYSFKEINRYEYFTLPLETGETQIAWSSSDPSVASVSSDGTVFGVKGGNAVVTVNVAGNVYSCTVAVKDSGFIPTVEIDLVYGNVQLAVGENYTLVPYLTYNAKIYEDVTFKLTVSSGVVTVDQSGKITAVSVGTANVEITATWRGCNEILNRTVSVIVA